MLIRLLVAFLVVLLVLLQYRLWVADGGIFEVRALQQEIVEQRQENAQLRERNRVLEAEVRDLKEGMEAIEERARSELGMIGEGETFVQIVAPEAQE